MQPTLKQLRYFAALGDALHFGRAATSCHISQPALSAQVRELERALGVHLVERTSHSVVLTPTGAELAVRARAILSQVGDLVDLARHRGRVLFGTLRLGMIATVGPYLLPRLVPTLHRDYPELQLMIRESITQTLMTELVAGGLDAAIVAGPVPVDGLGAEILFEDPFHLVVHRDHALTARAAVRAPDLEGERVLLLEEGHCLRDQALEFCPADLHGALDGFGATSLRTLVQMVSHGYGLTLVPALALRTELEGRPEVAIVPFASPAPTRTLMLAWRATSPRATDFAALARAVRGVGTGARPASDERLQG